MAGEGDDELTALIIFLFVNADGVVGSLVAEEQAGEGTGGDVITRGVQVRVALQEGWG